MTESERYEIAVLAQDYEIKAAKWRALGMMNTYGLSQEERTARSIAYHLAEAEAIEALHLLERAKQRLGTAQSPPPS